MCIRDSCDDECGVPLGDNSTCADECGVANGDNSSCADYCGIPNGPNVANECEEEEEEEAGCVDCVGNNCDGYESWIGDGLCDDGAWGLYFNCDEFDNDAGDCDSGDSGGYPDVDCQGQDYSGYEGWIGDGWCDDGAWGLYFNCDEFNNDEGDCDGRSDDQDIDDGFRAKKAADIANMEAKDYYVASDNRDGDDCGGTGPDIDCAGDCFGDAAEDCAGECNGSAVVDECGECNGDGIDEGTCDCAGNVLDCAGDCGGSAVVDECGTCNGCLLYTSDAADE